MRNRFGRTLCVVLAALCAASCPGMGPYAALAQTLSAPVAASPFSPFPSAAMGAGASPVQLRLEGLSVSALPGGGATLPSARTHAVTLPAPAAPSTRGLAPAATAGAVPAAQPARSLPGKTAETRSPASILSVSANAEGTRPTTRPASAQPGPRSVTAGPRKAGPQGSSPAEALKGLGMAVSRQGGSKTALKSSLDSFFTGTLGTPSQEADPPGPAGQDPGSFSGRGLSRLSDDGARASAGTLPQPSGVAGLPAEGRLRRGLRAAGLTVREMLFGEAEFAPLRRPYLNKMNLSRLIMVLQAVLGTALAYSTGAFVDAALAHAAPVALPWFAAMVGLIAVRTLIGRYLWVLGERIKVGMRQDFRMAFFSHLQRLPPSYSGRGDAPEITMRLLYDVGRVTTKNADIPIQTPMLVVQLLMAAGFVLHTSLPLGLGILVSLPILAFLSSRFGRKSEAQQRRISAMQADLIRLGQDLFTANRDGRASGGDAHAASVYKTRTDAYEGLWLEVAKLCSSYSALRDFLQTAFGELLILGAGMLSFLLTGAPSVGQIMALRGYANDLRGSFSGILDRYNDGRSADGGLSRVHELRKALAAAADKQGALDFSGSEVSFQDVRYALPGRGEVLRGAGFSVRAGERVLVVGGETASRRSLVDLLLRLDSPSGGLVRAGSADVADLKRNSLISNTALVSGEAAAFSGTLRDNLLLGAARPASDEELVAALRAAGAASLLDLSRLPKGLDTLVEDKAGVPLDAEQRQRLALARAALKGPAVLVGEDLSQGLEPGDGRGLARDFERLSRGRTTLVFAGQPERGEGYDRIVVLHEGRVVESGTHAELMALGGRYKDLVEASRLSRSPS